MTFVELRSILLIISLEVSLNTSSHAGLVALVNVRGCLAERLFLASIEAQDLYALQ